MNKAFGATQNGQTVEAITLSAGDLSVTILTQGAILQDVRLKGVPHSLTLGSDDIRAYDKDFKYFGALVGPVANRLSNATAPLDGATLQLVANEGETSLHGGPDGIHQDIWTITDQSTDSVTLELNLPDGRGGYPGNRVITACFTAAAPAQLTLEISVTTDAATLINIANHSFWNMDGTASMAGHVLTVPADDYTPVDTNLIPTGVASVEGTGFDLRTGSIIGLPDGERLDHNFCLTGPEGELKQACTLTGTNGLSMSIETTEVGLQVYDAGANPSSAYIGHNCAHYGAFSGVALEAQRWPDAPNQDGFPPCELRPDETYQQTTRWTFSRA
ncbi:MAG: aldose epimerase family protein [Pacificibacter sp.]